MKFRLITLIAFLFFALVEPAVFASDFIDNGDGTVTDNDTNLMWMQETATSTMTWVQALIYCENLSIAGYSDWRLPNIKEIRSIVDYNTFNPAIDQTFFPDTKTNKYWTSTTVANDTPDAWSIEFYGGAFIRSKKSHTDMISNMYWVRAVRGGQ